MASGYDNRPVKRDTFAFTGPDPVQTRPDAQANFRNAEVVGGRSQGGVVTSEVQAPAMAGNLGQFFEGLMRPYTERRQKEAFFKGLTEQMSRSAGDEIRASDSPINRIFGPTAYEEGATFYAAKTAVSKWQVEKDRDMDMLKRLPPEELSKVIAADMDGLMTDDPTTNQAIQSLVVEAAVPLIAAVGKKRYAWQQDVAHQNYAESVATSADALQALGKSFYDTTEPEDGAVTGWQLAQQQFLSGLQQPPGMDEETWKKSLMSAYRNAAQSGNGYAVSLLKKSGFLDALSEEDRVRLETAEDRLSSPARAQAAMALAGEISLVQGNVEFGRMSPEQAMSAYAKLNDQFKRMTGFDNDLFDYKETVGVGKSVWSAMKAQKDKDEQRAFEQRQYEQRRADDLQDKQDEANRKAAQIGVMWGAGQVALGLSMGIGEASHYNLQAQKDFVAGDYTASCRRIM